ncbi:MAG: FAD-dependent oxidoreductase [Eubacteriales bacterium]|nr:FAD-dependent oxidoreductase [Eubacteriales bacterium]
MTIRYDVIVCGGGIAGIAASLSAARTGAKTCMIEKEYAPGGLATLGLIVIYLPLDDGDGIKMSGGIAEELLKTSLKYGPGVIPPVWADESKTRRDRAGVRYSVRYEAAPFMIAAEELLVDAGVTILYDTRLASAQTNGLNIQSITVDTKRGALELSAAAYVDATGDADLCFFAGEKTACGKPNSRTGWYYSFDGSELRLNGISDPYDNIPSGNPTYNGIDPDDISRHMIHMRRFILEDVKKKNKANKDSKKEVYPLIIPAFHGLRTTRRLAADIEFSENLHERVWFDDAVGMIGNWKKRGMRYSIPYRSIKAEKNGNLYAAGRCVSADNSGWDLTRVIPSCAVTGEAAGLAAAMQADSNHAPDADSLALKLRAQGVPIDKTLFANN